MNRDPSKSTWQELEEVKRQIARLDRVCTWNDALGGIYRELNTRASDLRSEIAMADW